MSPRRIPGSPNSDPGCRSAPFDLSDTFSPLSSAEAPPTTRRTSVSLFERLGSALSETPSNGDTAAAAQRTSAIPEGAKSALNFPPPTPTCVPTLPTAAPSAVVSETASADDCSSPDLSVNAAASERASQDEFSPTRVKAASRRSSSDDRKSPSLYVGDLHRDMTETLLYELFLSQGTVQSIRVCRDMITHRSLGYAYVNFGTIEEAEKAMEEMNNFSSQLTNNIPLRIMWAERDPSKRRMGNGNLHVSNIDTLVDSKMLLEEFVSFGAILSCKVSTDTEGASLGYGYVHFEDESCADEALSDMDGKVFHGRKLRVKKWMNKREREAAGVSKRSFTNVYVKNLHHSMCTPETLVTFFDSFGAITSVHAPLDDNGAPKGFALLNFAEPTSAAACVSEMNGYDLLGQALFVGPAQKRAARDVALQKARDTALQEQMRREDGQNLYVKNICDDVTEPELRALFGAYGAVRSCRINADERGNPSGFGFVRMANAAAAASALSGLAGFMLRRKPLYVAYAQPRDVRRAHLAAHRAALAAAAAAVPRPPPQLAGGFPPAAHAHFAARPAAARAYTPHTGRGSPVAAYPLGAGAGRGRGGPIPHYGPGARRGGFPFPNDGGRGAATHTGTVYAAQLRAGSFVSPRPPRQNRECTLVYTDQARNTETPAGRGSPAPGSGL